MILKFWCSLIWVLFSLLIPSYGFTPGAGLFIKLDSPNTRVDLQQKNWTRAGLHPEGRGAPDQLQIPVTVRTESQWGRIFTIYGREENDVVFTLAIKIEDGYVTFDLTNRKGENIANGRGEKINDNQPHDFVVRIDGKDRQVGLDKVDGKTQAMIHARDEIMDTGTDVKVKIIVGHIEGEEDSIIGCISLVTLALGNDIDILSSVDGSDYESCDVAKDPLLAPIGQGTEINQDKEPQKEAEPVEDPKDEEKDDEPVLELEPKFPLPENNTILLKSQDEDGLKIGSGVGPIGKKPDPPTEVNCHPHEKTMCQNSKSCIRRVNETDFICKCKDGFAGRFCQFSLFPRTCYDAIKFFQEKEPGVYELDVDGSGPMEPTFAQCSDIGATIVAHNMPNNTEVRSPAHQSSRYFPIAYKLFAPEQLKTLIERSESCEQYVRYECDGAPLKFAENKTFFATVNGDKMVRQIGDTPNACPCKEHGCNPRKSCQCDATGVGYNIDEGYLRQQNSGVSFIYSRKYPNMGTAKMTLGPLTCSGEAGHASARAVTVKSNSAKIPVHEKYGWTHFEFEFRTNQAEIGNFLTADAGDFKLNVGLAMGHRVILNLKNEKAEAGMSELSVTIMSQSKLNDLKWHRIIVETLKGEVRLSVDKLNAFEKFFHVFPETQFTFGAGEGTEDGFIGCLRNFIVGQKLVNLNDHLPHDVKLIGRGCSNLCEGHLCEQESRCIEHFEDGSTSCECKNKFIHSGERCEQNVNKGTEVSFHNRVTGFLKYTTKELPENPLTSNIIFSARTDQKKVLFVYAHDQNDNFVQVHLADEYRIVLTLNNQTDIKHCTVYSKSGKEFSDMRWLQIVVERSEERTTLTVNDEMCEIQGKIILAETNIEDAFNTAALGRDDILPPKAPGPVVASQPYQILFVGGVPRASLSNYRRTKRERTAYYITEIPPILGCMRGFMLGNSQLDLRTGGIRPTDPSDVRIGCHNDCETIVCNNGGHCTVQWHNYDPAIKELTSCDCSKTSFYGSNCLKDSGVMFTGTSAIFFNMTEPRKFMLHESDEQTFQFAFSPTSGNHQIQRLATIYFDDNRQFQVTLNRNDSINVGFVDQSNGSSKVWTFPGNFSDGYRHFFQSTFTRQDPILILVDSEKKYLDEDIRLHLGDARAFYFGGFPVLVTDMPKPKSMIMQETTINHSIINRYHGCMSNIDIDFHRNEAVHFRPLIDYGDPSQAYFKSVQNEPPTAENLGKGACPGFRIPGALPTQQRNVQFPLWEAPFGSVDFIDDHPEPAPQEDEGGSSWWIWLIIILVLLILVALLVCCYCCLCKKPEGNSNNRAPDPMKRPMYPEDHHPLNPGGQNPPIGNGATPGPVIRDDYNLPPPTKPLIIEGRTQGHPTDPLPNYGPSHKDDPMDMIDDESQLAEGYGEDKPELDDEKTRNMTGAGIKPMSSFGKADRTAPPRSPLNRSSPVQAEPRVLKPIFPPKPKNLTPSPDQSPV